MSNELEKSQGRALEPATKIVESIPRETTAWKCSCGGYCAVVEIADAEYETLEIACVRGCCDVAFQCCLCKKRWIGVREAPEME